MSYSSGQARHQLRDDMAQIAIQVDTDDIGSETVLTDIKKWDRQVRYSSGLTDDIDLETTSTT